MKHTRPKNLNLFTIRFPIPAIASILHRMSGFFLFLLIPFMLWALSYSLTDYGFYTFEDWFTSSYVAKFILWVLLIPFLYHLVAGIRHLFSDIHIGNSLKGGRRAVWIAFGVTAVLIISAGIWLW